MKLWKLALSAIFSIVAVNIVHAATIQYEVNGSMQLSDINWNSITSHEMTGYMYISDVDTNPADDGVYFEIESFVFRAGGYEWSGTGYIHGFTDRFLTLDGPGDWEMSTGIIPSQFSPGWSSYQLPAEQAWPGDGWQYEDELLSRVASLDMQVVPIPAAAWLFGSGLIGLVGFARRKKV